MGYGVGDKEKQRRLPDHEGETTGVTEKAWTSFLSRLAEVMGKDKLRHPHTKQDCQYELSFAYRKQDDGSVVPS